MCTGNDTLQMALRCDKEHLEWCTRISRVIQDTRLDQIIEIHGVDFII
jgi:hypothetical protein